MRFMEVCGTHTVSAARGGVHALLPFGVRLLSGPGCPVCVTPRGYVDALLELAKRPEVIVATYGDLVRVTGAAGSLERARGDGADVRVVTSSLDALALARGAPDRQVVFAAVGFETTAPATAAALLAARREGQSNFTALSAHKLVLPALRALIADPSIRVDGFLLPGHVSVVVGADHWRPVVTECGKPCAVAGFEPRQILEAIRWLADRAAAGRAELVNLYPEIARPDGNPRARALIEEVFAPVDSVWRALGTIPESGLALREEFAAFDAARRFGVAEREGDDPAGCRCGEVITGRCDPPDCALFGGACTPLEPVGPCMVSGEGACQAFFRYRRAVRSPGRG
jgi:hydrogenase expression/formation protein HypD